MGDSAVVGQLFARDDGHAYSCASKNVEADKSSLDLNELLRTHWGNFALFSAFKAGSPIVYRDPSGAVCVYQHEQAEGIFVSDAELARTLGLIDSPAIDTDFMRHWLQFPFLRTARTGIEGIREVLPGTCRTRVDGVWSDRPIWHPSEFTRRKDAILDPDEAANRLRRVALATVARQVRGPVVLQLSGGLDSSILAACLHEAEVPFTGVNFATRSADGDERRYARAVAVSLGVPLVEIEEEELRTLSGPTHRDFRPGTNPLLAPFERAVDQCAEEVGASLIVDGGGGDNLFCSVNSAAPVLDALYWAGPRTAIRTVDDITSRAGCTSWEVVRSSARRAWKGRYRRHWKEDRYLLKREAILTAPEGHPWLSPSGRHQPGKLEHIESLIHIQHFLDRTLTPSRNVIHPLIAQPLLELCLRIPTWLWLSGGRDRAIARQAFNGLLPESVLQRRTKGSLQSLFHRSFHRLSGEIRDLLLTGELRKLGILDADAVEEAFRSRANDEFVQLRLTEMTALELWLQSWRR
jgi:asparagine synthase (glutamine-hydrolysing)